MSTPSRGRSNRRLGLALAGGGPEGAVYELGALRALEESIEGLDFTRCDVYVGVSAGAFIASALANGIGTPQLVRGLVVDEPDAAPFDPARFFRPAYGEWARRGAQLPRLLAEALWQFTRARQDQRLMDSLIRLSRSLPPSLFDNDPIRRYLEAVYRQPGRTNDFRRLERQLFVVAADLEAGVPMVFGSKGLDHVPISLAVQASTALPGLYPPVEVEGRLCVDGVLLKTVHASVALEQGINMLFCVNPLVPVDVAAGEKQGVLGDGALLRGGLPALMSQTFRTLIHSRMVVGMARYETDYPEADVALFEPKRSEYRLFFRNIFTFAARREVCEIAYEATRQDLLARRAELTPMLKRHGLALRLDVLQDATRNVWEGVGLPIAGGPPKKSVTDRLSRALERLEAAVPRRGRRRTG
jgi:predicted acylesterase/phospholipase RssA